MAHPTGATVALTASRGDRPGRRDRRPAAGASLHWGRELPALDAEQAEALADRPGPGDRLQQRRRAAAGGRAARAARRLDWAGRACAARAPGARWSPRVHHARCALDGADVSGFVSTGAGRLEVGRGGRRGRPGAAADHGAAAQRAAPLAGRGHQHRPTSDYGLDELVLAYPVPAEADRAARLRRPAQPGAHPAAAPLRASAPTCGRTARAAPARTAPTLLHAGTPGLRLRRRRGVRRAHGVERQPHALRRAGVHRRAGARRRRAAAARRDPAGARRELPEPVAVRRVRRRAGRGGRAASTGTCAARPRTGLRRPAGDPQRLGGGLLRPRPGPAAGPGRARGRARRRALRARRRLVRRPPRRPRRPRRLGGLARRLAATGCTR